MRLFINGEKVWEGKPESLALRIETDGAEHFGPFTLHCIGEGSVFHGRDGKGAMVVYGDPNFPYNYGLTFVSDDPFPGFAMQSSDEKADEPTIISR